jgi:hypothetical protein
MLDNFLLYSRYYEYYAIETLNSDIFFDEYYLFCLTILSWMEALLHSALLSSSKIF